MVEDLKLTTEGTAADSDTCVITSNRSVASGSPLYFSTVSEAAGYPVAEKILGIGSLDALLIQGEQVTLLKSKLEIEWAPIVNAVEGFLKEHFETIDSERQHAERAMTTEEEGFATQIQAMLDRDVNPMVASHGGVINVLGVKETTLYLHMGGGCQGCGMAAVTLRQGVETAVAREFPQIERILDSTDHAAGTNPFYAP